MAELGAQLRKPLGWRNQPLPMHEKNFGNSMARNSSTPPKDSPVMDGRPRLHVSDSMAEDVFHAPANKAKQSGQASEKNERTTGQTSGRKPTSDKAEAKPGKAESKTNDSTQNQDSSVPLNTDKKGSADTKIQQKRLRLLQECEGVLMANFDWLEMADYPDNLAVAQAKKIRDYWVFALCILLTVVIMGFWGYLPAWVTGGAIGAMVVLLTFGIRYVRNLLFDEPNYSALLDERKKMEFRALSHIKLLEGREGLAWRLLALYDYNPVLRKKMFSGYGQHSKAGSLVKQIKSRAHIRLYLLLLIEADKAYRKLKTEYFEVHHQNQHQGIDDLA